MSEQAEIARLEVENERLREALRRIARSGDDGSQDSIAPDMWASCRELAADALTGEPTR